MANIELDGVNKKIKVDSGDLTLDVPGDIVLDADGGDVVVADGGTNILKVTNSSSDVVLQPQVDAKDIIFKQYDGTTVATVEDNGTFNVPASKLAIGDTAVTATASELNLLDGGTSVGSSITLADGDGFVVNDGGTMKTIPASDVSTYAGGGDLSFGGDTFGADKVIGSNDAYALSFETNNTVGLKIDNAGHITKPLQPAFLVKSGSTQSNYATATTHTVQFSNEVFDQNADYDTSTYTFTAPVTGRYQLSCGLKINQIDKDSDYYQGQIVVSNNSIDIFNVRTAQVFNEDSTYYRWTVSMLVDMDANDTAYVTFRPQAGDATADINVNESLFSGFLAC